MRIHRVVYILAYFGFAMRGMAQGLDVPAEETKRFNGSWAYRSFVSNPDLSTPVDDLLFGAGTMKLQIAGQEVTGTLGGTGWELVLKGQVSPGNPPTVRMQGTGTIGGEPWVYDYLGYLVPKWPAGVDQRPAIVGSIIRSAPHSGGNAKAGVVAQWIAVRADGAGGVAALATPSDAGMRSLSLLEMQMVEARAAEKQSSNNRLRQAYLDAAEELKTNPPPAIPPPKILPSSSPSGGPGRAPSGESLRLIDPAKPAGAQSSLVSPSGSSAPSGTTAPTASLHPTEVKREPGGRLFVELNVGYNESVLKIGKDEVKLRTYSHRSGGDKEFVGPELVGPVIRAKAGETLYITLKNNLPDEDDSLVHGTNGHHEWNTTNLHFHGLHVAPQGPPLGPESDNVLLSVLPGEEQKYEVVIPKDHVAGTFWYHAHRHGSTAAQVSSGLAGALIIERDDDLHNLDSVPEIAAAAQEVMVLQAVPYLVNRVVGTIDTPLSKEAIIQNMLSPGSWKKLRRYITVNGLKIPTITIAPGEVRRLRFIQAGQREPIQLKIVRDPSVPGQGDDSLNAYEIAVDGLPTGRITEWTQLLLYPGYRSDVLIHPSPTTSGEFFLVDENGSTASGEDGSPEPVNRVARIVVTGEAKNMALPKPETLARHALPAPSGKPNPQTQYAFYGIDLDKGTFNISDQLVQKGKAATSKEYEPSLIRRLKLGTMDKWIVGSRNAGVPIVHPFHIHVNPFYIIEAKNEKDEDVLTSTFGGPVWRDTLAMKEGYTYTLLTEYTDFTGTFVNHCHILDHEDRGMMEKVVIEDPKNPSPNPSTSSIQNTTPMGMARAAVPSAPAAALPPLLEPYKKAPVLAVSILSVNCGACVDQVKSLEKAAQDPGWPAGLRIVIAAPDAPAEVAQFLAKSGLKKCRVVSDPEYTLLAAIDPGAAKDERRHGMLLVKADGSIAAKSASAEPLPAEAITAQFPALGFASLSGN